MNAIGRRSGRNPLYLLLTVSLMLSTGAFVWSSLRWPMVGDSGLMHYAIFLMNHGEAPYRDIAELNLPGSYFVEWLGMRVFGGSDLAWRFFDLALSATGIAAMVIITLPVDWFAGVWAGTLLLLIHGRDGIPQLGQRDFTVAICLLAGYAALFVALRHRWPTLVFLFGLLTGLAAGIKPTVFPLGIAALALLFVQLRRQPARWWFVAAGVAGFTLPWLGDAYFLWREKAFTAFSGMTVDMIAYHAGLEHRTLGYLLLHSISPLLPLVAGWVALLILQGRQSARLQRWLHWRLAARDATDLDPDLKESSSGRVWERRHLLLALAAGLLSYLVQAKGYAYQRYPFLAFLLLLMAVGLVAGLRRRGLPFVLALASLAFGGLALAPLSALAASRYDWRDLGTVGTLEQDLRRLLPLMTRSQGGGVECLDSISGCVDALYHLRLVESSSVFYDELLFGRDGDKAVRESRAKFWREIQATQPAVIIVTSRLFPGGPDNYAKLSQWPEFSAYLAQRYWIEARRNPVKPVRWWGRPEVPDAYRIYIRNGAALR